MDKWCQAHNDYHSNKTWREFINVYNAFLALAIEYRKANSGKEEFDKEV
jgi:hypothetical protein